MFEFYLEKFCLKILQIRLEIYSKPRSTRVRNFQAGFKKTQIITRVHVIVKLLKIKYSNNNKILKATRKKHTLYTGDQ